MAKESSNFSQSGQSQTELSHIKEVYPIHNFRILLIEDQYDCQLAVLNAIFVNFGDCVKQFANGKDVLLVTNYEEAKKIAEAEGFAYQLVFLDNSVPYEPIDRSQQQPYTGDDDLMKFPKDAFTFYEDSPDDWRLDQTSCYRLIDQFREKGAVVVGTSSMDASELTRFSSPDFAIKKYDVSKSLTQIKDQIQSEIKNKQRQMK